LLIISIKKVNLNDKYIMFADASQLLCKIFPFLHSEKLNIFLYSLFWTGIIRDTTCTPSIMKTGGNSFETDNNCFDDGMFLKASIFSESAMDSYYLL